MKKMLILLMSLALIAGFSTASLADILGSAHDLSTVAGVGEICVFCHVPHNPLKNDPNDSPLWNHADTTQTFNLYGGGTATAAGGNNSILCLSCHDGLTNLDAFGASAGTVTMTDVFAGSPAIVGTNLADDHPVMVAYPGAGGATADYKAASGFAYAAVFSDNVECASCHDPHDTTNAPFLRAANTNSQLCLDCHIK